MSAKIEIFNVGTDFVTDVTRLTTQIPLFR